MSRPHYLCKKVQPGEIKPMTADMIRMMAQAEDLVAYGIRRGLMAYPPNTQFDKEGRPIPKITVPSAQAKPIEAYPCLRAYLMHDAGSTHVEVAKAITASTAKIGAIIAHGREIYRRQAVEIAKEGQETIPELKRASGAGNAQGGAYKAGHLPPGGNPPAKNLSRRGQSRPRSPRA